MRRTSLYEECGSGPGVDHLPPHLRQVAIRTAQRAAIVLLNEDHYTNDGLSYDMDGKSLPVTNEGPARRSGDGWILHFGHHEVGLNNANLILDALNNTCIKRENMTIATLSDTSREGIVAFLMDLQ